MLKRPFLQQLIANNLKIKIEPLIKQRKLQESALRFVANIFARYEPLTIESNGNEEDVSTVIQSTFESCLKHSSIAFTPHDNTILGVILSADVYQLSQANNDIDPPLSMQPIINLLDNCSTLYLEKQSINKQQLKENHLISQMMIAVKPEAAGINLGFNILMHNLQLAKNNQFELAKIECTSKRSASLSQKLDYDLIDEVNYDEVKVNPGNKVYWKDLPIKFNESKLFILSKRINTFDINKYNQDTNNIYQFIYN